MMRRVLALVFAPLLSVALLGAPAAANHSWNDYHWSSGSTQLTVVVGDNVSGPWDPLLTTVEQQWATEPIKTDAVTGSTVPATCAPVEGTVQACNSEYGDNGWLGLARIWLDADGHIVQGTAQVNDTYFNTDTYDDDTARLHVLCHEVGHTLGLGHRKRPQDQSCMNDNWGLFDDRYDQPDAHDYEQLNSIYGHDDSANGGDGGDDGGSGGPPCSKNPDHPNCDPNKFGAGHGSHGNETVHVSRGPNGQTIVTFILWA